MNPQDTHVVPTNGVSAARDLFALTDEQILEIEPEAQDARVGAEHARSGDASRIVIPSEARNLSSSDLADNALQPKTDSSVVSLPRNDGSQARSADATVTNQQSPGPGHEPEPPEWLARMMKDQWAGDEAREFWDGVQRAQGEAAAYRAAIGTPAEAVALQEDARALKELYPGGVAEARSAAQRARALEEIDRAYFGAQGAAPADLSASRTQLAARMMREDPAAFREMVMAGLQVLQDAEGESAGDGPRLARVVADKASGAGQSRPGASTSRVAQPSSQGSSTANRNSGSPSRGMTEQGVQGSASSALQTHAGVKPGATQNIVPSRAEEDMQPEAAARYVAFERAANEDLERSVGAAIARTIGKALPNLGRTGKAGQAGAQHSFGSAQDRTAPLQERLAGAVRADVEAALKSDRQLGEQVAQVLAARRFDEDSRAQVVRLINERAQQLVPVAARRVLAEWTQATVAAHAGARAVQSDERRDPPPADVFATIPRLRPDQQRQASTRDDKQKTSGRRVDYRKLSDEEILAL